MIYNTYIEGFRDNTLCLTMKDYYSALEDNNTALNNMIKETIKEDYNLDHVELYYIRKV